jgi:hypothetical protein
MSDLGAVLTFTARHLLALLGHFKRRLAFAWFARFRRLAREYERLPQAPAGLHLVASAIFLLKRAAELTAHAWHA